MIRTYAAKILIKKNNVSQESGVGIKTLLWDEFHKYLRYVDTNNWCPNLLCI